MALTFLNGDAVDVAKALLGSYLVRELNGQKLAGKIVETEAYHQNDAASHSYRGQTPRTEVMFGPAGHAYVYFTYGMHYCFNIVTGKEGEGSAVLIRALEPREGLETMKKKRGLVEELNLTNGPAKLCQALKIDKTLNKHDLRKPPLVLKDGEKIAQKQIAKSTRIGISRDTHRLWRFFIKDNPYVSKR